MNFSSSSETAKRRLMVTDFATRGLGLGLLIDWLKPESRAAVRRWVAWWIRKSWRLPGAAPLWS